MRVIKLKGLDGFVEGNWKMIDLSTYETFYKCIIHLGKIESY